jgi:creatinine amidohydrolase
LRRLIEDGVRTVIVPLGSIEHQDGHLPLGADSLLADRVGRQVADRLDAVLAPTVRVGFAPEHAELTGTLTLPAETLTDMAVAIAESLAEQGFRLVVLVSIHGGNAGPLRIAVERFNLKQTGERACAPRGEIGPDPGRHSGRWLTSVMLALHPELVDLPAAAEDLRAELRTGDAHRGTVYLERSVGSILDEVRRVLLDRHPLN